MSIQITEKPNTNKLEKRIERLENRFDFWVEQFGDKLNGLELSVVQSDKGLYEYIRRSKPQINYALIDLFEAMKDQGLTFSRETTVQGGDNPHMRLVAKDKHGSFCFFHVDDNGVRVGNHEPPITDGD